MRKVWVFLGLLFHALSAVAEQQLLLVTTPSVHAMRGKLQRYQRVAKQPWQQVGNPIPIVIGKQGLTASKREGDLSTPMGIYGIQTAFFASHFNQTKLAYMPLNGATVCVDDVSSRYYNQIVNSQRIRHKDWKSGEEMQKIDLYQLGVVIEYNTRLRQPGKGSCIFMHVWRNATSGTAGCVAMSRDNLEKVLAWLDAKKKPIIAFFPENIAVKQLKYKDVSL